METPVAQHASSPGAKASTMAVSLNCMSCRKPALKLGLAPRVASAARPRAAHPSTPSQRRAFHSALRCSATEPKPDVAAPELLRNDALAELPQHEEVLLRLEGVNKPLHANKALLSLMSPVLRRAFANIPSCKELQVEGSLEAWQLIIRYPLMSMAARKSSFIDGNFESARLFATTLEVAHNYNVEVLLDDLVEFAKGWTKFVWWVHGLSDNSGALPTLTPDIPAWWVDLASKHNHPELVGPAVSALVGKSTYRVDNRSVTAELHWATARKAHLEYGRKQQGPTWRLVCALLEGFDK